MLGVPFQPWAPFFTGDQAQQMTRRRKKHREPAPCDPERSEQTASGASDRLAAGPADQVRRPYSLPAVCALLLLAVIAVFGQTVGHDFVNFDDDVYVYENPHVRGGLTAKGIAWAFTQTDVSAQWQPLTLLSLMADAQVLKPAARPPQRARLAAGMHLVNVALHAANAVILFLLLRAMTFPPSPSGRGAGGEGLWPSALVAAIFAVHPSHVESVAWITERKDVLSGLFGLLAIGGYAWYARRPSVVRYLWVAAALALGLMAKPMLVTWPLLFLLLDYWPLGRVNGGWWLADGKEPKQTPSAVHRPLSTSLLRLVVEKIPLLLLVAAFAAVTFLAQRSGGAVIPLDSVRISARVARAAVLYVSYLGKIFWPTNLAAAYPAGPIESTWAALAAGVLLTVLSVGSVWGARRGHRWLAVGWFWYLGTLLPTIGLVQVGAAGDGRPFPVPAADWPMRGGGLGRCTPDRSLALSSLALRGRRSAGRGRVDGTCLAADAVLAWQRDVVGP